MCDRERVTVCMCVSDRETERERERKCVCMRERGRQVSEIRYANNEEEGKEGRGERNAF